jgi:hypothetical protein
MQNATITTPRRSSRVPAAVSILVTSLKGTHFSEVCETIVVSAHGCAMLTRMKLDTGIPLHFHSKEGRETTAEVVSCQPIGTDHRTWRLSARLDQPENFWGLRECPKDWEIPAAGSMSRTLMQVFPPSTTLSSHKIPGPAAQRETSVPDRIPRQLEAQFARMIGDALLPLQAEVTVLKEQLARRQANPSRFEVSLSSIPPELENQLEQRLRKDLGPKVLDEGRQQCAQLLATAKTTLDQRTSESHEKFLRQATQELQVVEQRAQEVSKQISETARDHFRRGLEEFQGKLLEGGNSLKRLSDELLEFLQQNVNAEYNSRRGELEEFRTRIAAESSRLHEHIEYLDVRIRNLDQAARNLESGLDHRLGQMSSNTVKETRSQLENVANEMLEELTTRVVKALGDQVDETRETMNRNQKEIVASGSESLKLEAANSLQGFQRSTQELAQAVVERCRARLAGGLNAVIKSMGEQFQG